MSAVRRLPRFLAAGLALLCFGALGGWSLHVLLAPPTPSETPSPYAIVTAETGTLGRMLTLNASAERTSGTTLPTQLEGTLTSLDAAEGEPKQIGDLLYTVDMNPVVLAHGEVPAYRELAEGMRGPDVAQLQGFLNTIGGYGLAEDGNFGAQTRNAVLDWNMGLGFANEASVPLGRLLFTSHVPTALTWAEGVDIGMPVRVGDAIAKTLQSEPRFTMTIPSGQLSIISAGVPASIAMGSSIWAARIGPITIDEETSEAKAQLVPVEGADSICGDECALIGVEGAKGLPTSITVIPEITGVIVPTAALRVDADAKTVLISEDGTLLPVEVLTSTQGRSVVSGIDEGTRVRVLADEGGAALPGDEPASDDSSSSAR